MPAILPYQQTVGQPGLGFTPQDGGPDYIAAGLNNVAGGLGSFSEAMREQKAKMDAAQSTLTLATLNNNLRDAHDKTAEGIQNGSIDPSQAVSTFATQANTLKSSALTGLSPQQQASIAPNIESTTGDLTRNLNVAIFHRGQSDAAGTIDDFGSQVSRQVTQIGAAAAAEKFGAFADFTGPMAGLSPEKIVKLKQSFSETVHYNAFDQAGMDALTRGDPAGLAEVRRQLMSADGDVIAPQKRITLEHTLYGYEQHVLAKQAAAANAAESARIERENAAGQMFNDGLDLSTSGKTMSPEFIQQLTAASVGTSHQANVVSLLSHQTDVAGFATKPLEQRQALLNGFEAEATTRGTDPDSNKMLTSLQSLNTKLQSAAKDNPWTAAQSSGVISDAGVMDVSNLDSAFKVVQQRNAGIGRVEAWAGTKVSPFQPQEVTQIAHGLQGLEPARQAAWLGKLGVTIGDPDRINQVAEDLDKTNKPMALALKMGTDQTTTGRASSAFVMLGAQALADKTVKPDDSPMTGWRADIAGKVRGTLGDAQAEQDIIDAAYYTRAALENPGAQAPGYKLDASTDQALKFVIGQPMERAGVKTFLPHGVDQNTFDSNLKKYDTPTLSGIAPTFYMRGQPISPVQLANRLSSLGMRRDGGGSYIPTSGNAFVTTDPAGTQPLRLNVQ